MSTLLLRLAGPMQSWGTQSRFTVRDTGLEPSKSGVIGLVCAALGRARHESVDDLARLRMGVRVDREGAMKMDYHTTGGTHRRGEAYGVVRSSGATGGTVTSNRYYLADADFLVGLEGEDATLEDVARALERPRWQLFLGRKAFVPGVPVYVPEGLRQDATVDQALRSYPWPRIDMDVPFEDRCPDTLRRVLEASNGQEGEVRMDQPDQGAAFDHRRFLPRRVETDFLRLGTEVPVRGQEEA